MTNKPYTRSDYADSRFSSSQCTPAEYENNKYSDMTYSSAAADSGSSTKDELLGKINRKDAHVAVIGQGYVGLPLTIELHNAGFSTVGIDIQADIVQSLNQGQSHIHDISSVELTGALERGLTFSTDYEVLQNVDCISITVPTPLTKTKSPDISYITQAIDALLPYVSSGTLIILESTTYPGTTEELVATQIEERRNLQVGKDVFVAFSPERVDPGNPHWGIKNTPKIVGGVTPACTEVASAFYGLVMDKIHQASSATEAETVKLLENTFRAVNIGLVNEFLLMCNRMNIDVWNVIDAASTKPFGFMPFFPGPGIGGHCIPLDPMYLSWKAKSVDFYNRFIELATDINGNMPRFVVSKLGDMLNDQKKALNGSRITILGIAYKQNVSDTRESPGLEVAALLQQKGALVSFCDPHVHAQVNFPKIESSQLDQSDAVVLVTAHDQFNYEKIAEQATLILDCRNAFRARDIHAPHIVPL